jgi:hypothetical protein
MIPHRMEYGDCHVYGGGDPWENSEYVFLPVFEPLTYEICSGIFNHCVGTFSSDFWL